MSPDVSPTVRRWELGSRLRELREGAGLSLDDVAKELLCSPSKISRIETAVRAPSPRDVRDLAQIYRVAPIEQQQLMELVKEARQPGWWKSYDEVDKWGGTYIGLEDAATAIRCVETIRIHGLLQTESYTRAMVRRIEPSLDEKGVEQFVETRRVRHQQILRSASPPSYWVVLDQAALSRQVGGPDVMREQVEHLLRCINDRLVTLQIIPFDAGAHPGMNGPFTIMEFADSSMSDVVYIEGSSGQVFLSRPADLRAFRETLNFLLAAAASPDDSIAILEGLIIGR